MSNLMPYRTNRNPIARSMFSPFEDDFFRPFFLQGAPMNGLRVDVKDEGDHYLLEADLPGFKKEDINIDVDDGVLTISAQANEEKKEEEKNAYVYNERVSRKYSRSFTLNGIDEEKIEAACENGVLKLTLPKMTETPKTGRKISIN